MKFEKIKQTIAKSTLLKVLLAVFVCSLLFFYFKAFYTTGIRFDDVFLKKEGTASEAHYRERSSDGRFHVAVKGEKNKQDSATVIYELPNHINQQYTVIFKDSRNWELGVINIKDMSGNVVFEGEYNKFNSFMFDKNGELIFEMQVLMNGESKYNAYYSVPLMNVADLASFTEETIRGHYGILVIAIFLFVYLAIDITSPLLFFNLKYALSVNDPEPSDLYLFMQKISWYVLSIIGVILLIIAIY